MSLSRLLQLALITVFLVVYGFRAVSGIDAGLSFHRGHILMNSGSYRTATNLLDRAVARGAGLRALQMAGDARIERWDLEVERMGSLAADRTLLDAAGQRFAEAICMSPASRRSLEGLGEAYDGLEWVGRERRATTPLAPVADPWERVGRPGRIAVGMMTQAIDTAPTWFRLQDKLALTLWGYGLENEAREQVRASARTLPMFVVHNYRKVEEIPPWFMDEFAASSRASLGSVPLVSRTDHLIDLGKLERRVGDDARAVETLREALSGRGDELNKAEILYHLGMALIADGSVDEGLDQLEVIVENPTFRFAALVELARANEAAGRSDRALDWVRQLIWEQPQVLAHRLRFARIARELEDWEAVIGALRAARTSHPNDATAAVALVDAYFETGDFPAAAEALSHLRGWPGLEAQVERLERQLRLRR